MAWFTDFWELWAIAGVAGLLEAIAVWQGKSTRRPSLQVRTISSRLWLAIWRYKHFTPLFWSFWAAVVPHLWMPPTGPGEWTTPAGWSVIVVTVVVIWTIHIRRRVAMADERTLGQTVREEPLWTKFAAGTGLVGVVVLVLKKFAGVDVDAETMTAVFVFIGALVTAWQRRGVTSMAKVDRLERGGKVESGTGDAIRQPPGPPSAPPPAPPTPDPFPRAQ